MTAEGARRAGMLAVVLAVFGLAFTAVGAFVTWKQWRVRSFLPVRGVVVASEIDVESGDSDGGGLAHLPRIRWRYEVDGRTFDGGTLRALALCGSETAARGVLARYPVGAEVEGRYDPARPEVAYLEHDLHWSGPALAAVGTLLLVGACVAGWRALRHL